MHIEKRIVGKNVQAYRIVVEKFKDSKISGHVTLLKGERSKLATEASRLI